MGRKRIILGPELDAEIATRAARGESARTIFHATGQVVSEATIGRRMREIKVAAERGVCRTCGRPR